MRAVMPRSPHNALFHFTFSKPEHAAGALRAIVPAKLVALIDFSTLSPEPAHFVDTKLRDRYSDLLFSLKIAGRHSLVYILFEHQSYADPWMLLRLLEYMVRIWRAYLGKHPRAKRIPVILPVVLHHSKKGWRVASRFKALLDVDERLWEAAERFVPQFEIVLDDISHENDAVLKARSVSAMVKLALYLFRYSRTRDELFAGLGRWADVLLEVAEAPDGGAAIGAVMEYLHSVTKRDEAEVVMAVNEAIGDSVYDRIMHGGDWFVRRGVKQGQREMLLRQLRVRFGELPESAVAQVNAADSAELTALAERILTAPDLSQALGEKAKPARKRPRR
jgi:hypothetical protein